MNAKLRFTHLSYLSVLLLTVSGCFLKTLPHSDYRPIHQAAIGCDVTTISQILATNAAALNVRDDGGRSPLHIACAHCCTNAIALLLHQGANVESKGNAGETPLHVAAQEGCVEAVVMLASQGAKINARDNQGRTPLKRAIEFEQIAAANLLRKLGGTE